MLKNAAGTANEDKKDGGKEEAKDDKDKKPDGKDIEVKNSPVANSMPDGSKEKPKKKGAKKTEDKGEVKTDQKEDDKKDPLESKTEDKEKEVAEKAEKKEIDEKKAKKDSFEDIRAKVMGELLKFFKPELVNRFDEVIVFEPLKYEHIAEIVKLQFKGLTKLMEDQEIGFYYTDEVIEVIVQAGYDPLFGARPLKRAIQKLIENPISNLIITGKAKPADVVKVRVDKDELVFDIEKTVLVPVDTKRVHCAKCDNDFKTEVVKNSTMICPKCLSYGDVLKVA
ncbi:MAG: hypothetical protein ACOYUB_03840 [Patescibacteria group bacterium]